MLPGEVFRTAPNTSIGAFYALYKSSLLFPVQETQNQDNTTRRTVVGSPVIAATVGEDLTIDLKDSDSLVTIELDIGPQLQNNTVGCLFFC